MNRTRKWAAGADYLSLLVVLALLVAVFGLWEPRFLSRATFLQIANSVPAVVVVAVGMTFVLIVGGIDLSVGSVLGLSGAMLGVAMGSLHWPLPVSIVAALAVGAACGWLSGATSVRWRLPSFIVTLGMLEIARGATHLLTHSQTQYIGSSVGQIAGARWLGLSAPAAVAVLLVALGQLVLMRTVFGRYVVAVGTNEEAVRLSGVDPRPVRVAVFTLAGFLGAVAGIIETSRLEAADPNAGMGLELQVIAAVVVGGTSLMGGRGSVALSFLGVLIIAVLGAGLVAIGARDEVKRLVTGLVIIAAVVLDYYRHRLASAGEQ